MVVCGGTNSKMEKKPAAEGLPARILVCTPASFELPIWLSPLSPLVISVGVMRSCGIEGAVALQVATRMVIAYNQLFFIKGPPDTGASSSQKLDECLHGLLRTLFHQPMPAAFQLDHLDISRYTFHLWTKDRGARLFACDR